jgi:hypothetical protein
MRLQPIFYISSVICINSLQFNLHSDGLEWASDQVDRAPINRLDGDALVMHVLRIKKRIGRVLRLSGGTPLLKLGGAGIDSSTNPSKKNAKNVKKKNLKTIASTGSDDEEEEEEGHWKPMCRICYEVDPAGLFVPCKCTGSMGFVHRLQL